MTKHACRMMSEESKDKNRKESILTVERAAWVAVGLLAAGLRLLQLGLRPLSEAEAVQALAAHRFTHGAAATAPAAPAGTLPALFTGNVIGFSLLGASDASARWLPALAGLILVLLPYGLRHRLGRGGALAASLLLTLSPSTVYFSRTLDSAILVAASGLALAVSLIDYLDTQRPSSLYLAAVALGLGLCTGPGTFTLLLIFAAFALVLYLGERVLGSETGWASLAAAWQALRSEKGLLPRTGVVAAATFGLAATAFVLHPAGVGHAADLLGAWALGFLPEPGGEPIIYPLLLLLRYGPLILLFGLMEAVWAVLVRRRDPHWWSDRPRSSFPHTAFLAFWTVAAATVVLVSGHRPAGNILLVVVPLSLMAGQGIERAWRWVTRRQLWTQTALFAGAALGLLAFIYLQVAAYGLASPNTVYKIGEVTLYTTSTYLILASVGLLLLVILGAAAWMWHGPELVLAGGWLTALIALGLIGFRAMWGLNYAHASDPRELMIRQATAPQVRQLVTQLEGLSTDEAGDAHTLSITTDAATGPVIAWYLRAFKEQRVVEDLSAPPDTVVAVTLAMQDPPIGESFRGQGFPLRTYWCSPPACGGAWDQGGQGLVRWLLFTDGDLPTVDQEVVLWVATQP
jgi:uncharacterized protein (TIGR03663 family)